MSTTKHISEKILDRLKAITLFNVLLLAVNLSVFINGGNVVVQCLTVAAVILLPGYVLTKLFSITGSFGQRIGFVVAFGIAYLLFLGLALNTVLPLFHFERPLGILPFFTAYNFTTLFLFILSLLLRKNYQETIAPIQLNTASIIFTVAALIIPLLTFFGTIVLNNGGSNAMVLAGLIGIAVYLLAVVIFRKSLADYVFPLSIFTMALALLLMYTSRNPFLMGWDIQNEYRVFLRTNLLQQWYPNSKGDIYNATLGVTILPTLLGHILTVKSFLIFKYLYPIIFAFSSLAFYYLLRTYLNRIAAFLGAFFCICQLSYVSMPSLARQEIGYLMFAFIIMMLFDKIHSRFVKNNVVLFLGLGMVITHYSTSYVAVLLLMFTYLADLVLRGIFRLIPKLRVKGSIFNINIFAVIILLLATMFWYGMYTEATENIENLFTAIKRNLIKIHSEETKASQSWITITGSNREATPEDLKKYIAIVTRQYRFDEGNLSFFKRDIVDQYPVKLVPIEKIKGDPVIEKLAPKLVLYDRQLVKIVMILGMIYFGWIYMVRKKVVLSAELLTMGYIYQLFIVTAIFVPAVSAQYNIERLYQQGLMLLAFFPVGLVQEIKAKTLTTAKYIVLTVIFIIYFFSHHGVINQLAGGEPLANLNNYGDDFGQYYIFQAEIAASQWYFKNRYPKITLYADNHATLRLASQGRVDNIISALIPAVIFRNGYVYVSYKNLVSGYTQAGVGGITINYTFPKAFLDDNKNLIYSNKSARIYQ